MSSSSSSGVSQDQARILAERIARRISHTNIEPANFDEAMSPSRATARAADDKGNVGEELAAVRAGLDELQHRLAHIESSLTRREETQGNSERPARGGSQGQSAKSPSSPFTAP